MKFCVKCGHLMDDDMLFCQKCGTKSEPIIAEESVTPQPVDVTPLASHQTDDKPIVNTLNPLKPAKVKMRIGMAIGLVFCLVFTLLFLLVSLFDKSILSLALLFLILSVMFLALSFSPKDSKYLSLFNTPTRVRKSGFVLLSVFVALIVYGSVLSSFEKPTVNKKDVYQQSANSSSDKAKNQQVSEKPKEKKTTLDDVEKWYINQTSAVSQSLMEYAKSIDGLTLLNVNSSKFRFGEDDGWYDCHYTFYFTCKVNGTTYNGEARAFMKYQETAVNWFHFEIFSNTGIQSLVEHYDDSYDQIIEDYYKELKRQYT